MAYSYYVNFTRIGVLIMLLHDISDIFLEVRRHMRISAALLRGFWEQV